MKEKLTVTNEEAGKIGEAVGVISKLSERVLAGDLDITEEESERFLESAEALSDYPVSELMYYFAAASGEGNGDSND
jgi:hypothetical protein